jgi:H+/Cl- antiporter ClcA
MHYIIEALIVGVVTAVVGFIISTALMYARNSDFSLKKYNFWPYVLFGYFITGFIIHLIFQWTGGNAWYCKHGDACS